MSQEKILKIRNNLSWATIIYVRLHGPTIMNCRMILLLIAAVLYLLVQENAATSLNFFSYFGMSQYFPTYIRRRVIRWTLLSLYITGTRCQGKYTQRTFWCRRISAITNYSLMSHLNIEIVFKGLKTKQKGLGPLSIQIK